MAVGNVLTVGGQSVPLAQFPPFGLLVGSIVTDDQGNQWQLTVSTATPDSTHIAVFGVTSLRWVAFTGGSGATVIAATPAALATVSVSGTATGQNAFVSVGRTNGGPVNYILQPAVSTTPDNFLVVPTADDSSRQWVHASIQEQGALGFISPEFDLTAVQTLTLLPPIAYTFTFTQGFQLVITAKDGTVTTGPTTQAGTNSSVDNLYSSTVQNIAPTVLNGAANLSTAVAASNNLDLSTNGIRLRITSGAVLGTATVFKARLRFLLAFNRY